MATTNFSKGIGKEYTDPEQRKRFLKDNADSVVEKSYMRSFSPEDLEQELKRIKDEYKERLKPLQEKHAELIDNIRKKAVLVHGICYIFVVEEERTTYIINEYGDCIESRTCTADEMQKTVFEPLRKNGTED